MSRLFSTRSRMMKDLRDDCTSQEKKTWSSESDLHHLPPLSPSLPILTSPRLSRKDKKHSPRPPTPSPNMYRRNDNFLLGKQRLGLTLSPSSSTQRLSLNLDLNALKEENMDSKWSRSCSSPDREKFLVFDNTRMGVRSLPTSPVTPRRAVRLRSLPNSKRLIGDSESSSTPSKDDRIAEWVREVQRYEDNALVEADDLNEFSSPSESSELGSSPGLPAIQENVTHSS